MTGGVLGFVVGRAGILDSDPRPSQIGHRMMSFTFQRGAAKELEEHFAKRFLGIEIEISTARGPSFI